MKHGERYPLLPKPLNKLKRNGDNMEIAICRHINGITLNNYEYVMEGGKIIGIISRRDVIRELNRIYSQF